MAELQRVFTGIKGEKVLSSIMTGTDSNNDGEVRDVVHDFIDLL